MFTMTVQKRHGGAPFLGVGTYYLGSEVLPAAGREPDSWVKVRLESPLLLNRRQVRMLVHKFGTASADPEAALSGAWRLRREVQQMGHDGIIAVDSPLIGSRLAIVEFAGKTGRIAPATGNPLKKTRVKRLAVPAPPRP